MYIRKDYLCEKNNGVHNRKNECIKNRTKCMSKNGRCSRSAPERYIGYVSNIEKQQPNEKIGKN